MKKLIYLFLIVLSFSACDNGFEEMNVDPTKPTALPPNVAITGIQMYTAGTSYVASLFYHMGVVMPIMQQLNCTSYTWEYTRSQDARFFDEQFPSSVKGIVDLVNNLEKAEGPFAETDLAIANVWKVLVFSRLTDAYGDIPYSEAAKGFIEGIRFPKYDTQESIYADMLRILEESSNILAKGGENSFGQGDVVYGGDTMKWKKFANSLMLRLAMRMVKVDPAAAQAWASKAIDAGVMESNDDIAYMRFESTAGYGGVFGPTVNPISRSFASRFGNQVKMAGTFIDFMKERNDPRVSVLSSTTAGETDFDLQVGQPNEDRSRTSANSKPNMKIFGGLVGWSWFRSEGNYDAPFFFQTYAEVELMLAEAAYRWGLAGGDVEDHYNKGVTSAMTYLKLYEAAALTQAGEATITQAQIDAYLEENPFNANEALKMINEQYWVASFPNGLETWANWKRSGYPELVPQEFNWSETDGGIPRRFTYPATERANNPDNLQEAIDRQGDQLTTRIWWDVN
ncbi:SusD/RagB family nutrient-binding outer membrane lipoprotein [Namhaeicola litoreus]|uniref:SusD/RagB family nutrient-binding outer membrane lipoprotein n=1 Tax=Namhaeicola litoreus TaxID=1052145 RepID=A0ABW3Y230_9FLAO